MKVLLRRNVINLGKIGEVVEVKGGYARNYLLPQGLAVQPTEWNVKSVEAEKQRYLEELAKLKAELQAKAELLNGKEITIPARANEEGHLYGSVGPAQIVAALAAENIFIEPHDLVLSHPIKQLDKYEIQVRFSEDVSAMINVWVVPLHDAIGETAPSPEGETGASAEAGQA